MEIYWILYVMLLFFGIRHYNNKQAFYFCAIVLLFVGMTRGQTVGADLHGGYSAEFAIMGESPHEWGRVMGQFEIGFSALMAFFKFNIANNGLLFFQLLFGVTFLNELVFANRIVTNKVLFILFFYAFSYYFQTFNAMRQEFCFSIIFLSMLLICKEKPKYKHFAAITIVASILFHNSQLILLALIPLAMLQYKISTKVQIILLLVSSIFGLTIAKYAMGWMGSIAGSLHFGNDNLTNYMQNQSNFGEFSQVSNMLNTLFCIFVVYIRRYKRDLFLNAYCLGIIILNVLSPIDWIFWRLAEPCILMRVITYAEMWTEIPDKRWRYIYRVAVILLATVMFSHRLAVDDGDVVPYVNVIFN